MLAAFLIWPDNIAAEPAHHCPICRSREAPVAPISRCTSSQCFRGISKPSRNASKAHCYKARASLQTPGGHIPGTFHHILFCHNRESCPRILFRQNSEHVKCTRCHCFGNPCLSVGLGLEFCCTADIAKVRKMMVTLRIARQLAIFIQA